MSNFDEDLKKFYASLDSAIVNAEANTREIIKLVDRYNRLYQENKELKAKLKALEDQQSKEENPWNTLR